MLASRIYGYGGDKGVIVKRIGEGGGYHPIFWWDSAEETFKTDNCIHKVPDGFDMFDQCVTSDHIENIPCN